MPNGSIGKMRHDGRFSGGGRRPKMAKPIDTRRLPPTQPEHPLAKLRSVALGALRVAGKEEVAEAFTRVMAAFSVA